jgi:hypothetical protein
MTKYKIVLNISKLENLEEQKKLFMGLTLFKEESNSYKKCSRLNENPSFYQIIHRIFSQ